jgi:hypothetical protein
VQLAVNGGSLFDLTGCSLFKMIPLGTARNIAECRLILVRCMDAGSKSRRNAFLMGAGLLLFGILQLLVPHNGYKTHRMIPAGEAEGQYQKMGFLVWPEERVRHDFSGWLFAIKQPGNCSFPFLH